MGSEEGSASLGVVGLAGVVMIMCLALADLAIFLLARAQAQTAADAAALAAAAELVPGLGRDPESSAELFARLNDAELVECRCRGGSREATVRVSVPVSLGLLRLSGLRNATASARAEVQLERGRFRPGRFG